VFGASFSLLCPFPVSSAWRVPFPFFLFFSTPYFTVLYPEYALALWLSGVAFSSLFRFSFFLASLRRVDFF
jgi:hypothetical protein